MLIPYSPSYFPVLRSWINDPYLLFQCAGPDFSFPLNEEQILQYQNRHPDRRLYLGVRNDQMPFAFGEIIPQSVGSVRLARLLVGEAGSRGKGWGESFVKELLAEAKANFKAHTIDLFVLRENLAAIRCYSKAGFSLVEVEGLVLPHGGKTYQVLKMRLRS
jgi:RimJ/RimL family protein N-acetyltransferase